MAEHGDLFAPVLELQQELPGPRSVRARRARRARDASASISAVGAVVVFLCFPKADQERELLSRYHAEDVEPRVPLPSG